MTEQPETPPTPEAAETEQSAARENWYEVGRQFQTLGQTLAAALRQTYDEAGRQRLKEVQVGLQAVVAEVGGALEERATSPEVQEARAEVRKAAQSARAAGEHAVGGVVGEVRPHMLQALRRANDELQKLIAQIEGAPPAHEHDHERQHWDEDQDAPQGE